MIKKITSVLIVDEIEPVLPLWEALDFKRTVEVPHGDKLGFVILGRDNIEVMYQTRESVKADEPRTLPLGPGGVFIEIENLDEIAKRIPAGTDVLVPRRETFYNSVEMLVRDAGGNVINFAQMKE